MRDGQLTSLLTPLLDQFGLELDALDSVPAGRRRLLRVVVDGDGPQGRGPSLDDISEATRAISVALDSADFLGSQPYTLEVSSRGTARPLTEPKHWRRNTGRLVKAILVEGGEVTGRVLSNTDETVTLEVVTDPKKQTTTQRDLAFADITKALVQVEFVSAKKDKTQEGEG
jgi:ribosome maturation factor RimP